ncbi:MULTISPECIES: branched-chain amino acid ABC transporter permease [Rhizobiaceae]|uniref:branched-chain amino acid ABC transporter permease n=1 Tax=Rhizobiaceae TaxID=82115 RepID=UPI0024123407|nr:MULTISPECIES: branched-chain amino acid ABC transporter permease [Rhizobiaceae]MDG3580292.1 branched-chain amino acid ABC transporter permease [Rhizobium sp. YJ-22]
MNDIVAQASPMIRSSFAPSLARRLVPALYLIAPLAALCVVVVAFGGSRLESSLTEALIYMVIVVGLSIFVGNSGIVSFGHVSFALIGAYASAWQTCCGPLRAIYMPELPQVLSTAQVPWPIAAVVAAVIAALVALVLGAALMRLAGTAASIALLSVLFVIKTAYENWDGWTGGQSAIVGLPTYVNVWVALGSAAAAIVVATLYRKSSFGLRLRAVREDEPAARSAGVNAWFQKLVAFTLSGFVAGLGGVLYGHYLGTITVSMFWLDMTFLTLAMLVVGGIRSLTGAVVGTLFVTLVRQGIHTVERGVPFGDTILQAPEGSREIALAIVLLAMLIFRPQGLVGDAELGDKE